MEKNLLTAKAVFDHVNEISSPTERRAYLDQACADDAVLREKVEGLLKAYQDAGSFLEPPQSPAQATVDHGVAEGPGSCIGRYKLLQQLGAGGMGIVYMAEQQEPVRRRVALKIIKPGMDTAQVIARFEAERQALAMMDHHNIARVLDAGTTDSGRPYFVMELVHGVPITKYCDDNQLTPRERLELLVPVCQAVQHAHQKGIIHRDIKPSNVMVCLYDGKPVPKVIDFGVAKATEQRLTERTLFTQYGAIVGTFEYMSPEQAEMSQLGVDTRSDVYSLGVLLYELLTGDTPLSRQRLREAAFDEVLRLIRSEDPPRPSMRLSGSGAALATISAQRKTEPAKLTRLVRGDLDWIVMKALEKDRTRRYDSASGLAKDLERYLHDEPVEACPPSPMYRLRKFARRHKTGVVTTLAIVFAALVSVIFQAINLVRAHEAEAAAQALALEKQQAADDAAKALINATKAKNDAELARQGEAKEKKIAMAMADELQRSLYFSRIHLTQRELAANNVNRVRDLLDKCPSELRHWEWHYLNRLSHAELLNLQHPAQVWNVAFSPDGQRLVSSCGAANAPSEVKVWDAKTGKELLTLSRHGKPVTCTAFSPDGKFLAWTGAATKFVKILDIATGKEVKTWSLPGVAVQIAFSRWQILGDGSGLSRRTAQALEPVHRPGNSNTAPPGEGDGSNRFRF